MTTLTLILRGLRFHARAHAGVLAGAVIGSAALVGALVVGDSVRGSLRDAGLRRLGNTDVALNAGDRLFRAALAADLDRALRHTNASASPGQAVHTAAALQLAGVAANTDGTARANRVQVLGVDSAFSAFSPRTPFAAPGESEVLLNAPLAEQLRVQAGDTLVLRVLKPALLSREAAIAPQEDSSAALRLKVGAIVPNDSLGAFSLRAGAALARNAFVSLSTLQKAIGRPDRANLLLVEGASPGGAQEALRQRFTLDDLEASLHRIDSTPNGGTLELRSRRVFLDRPLVDALNRQLPGSTPVLTYFVNEIRRVADSNEAAHAQSSVAAGSTAAQDAGATLPPSPRAGFEAGASNLPPERRPVLKSPKMSEDSGPVSRAPSLVLAPSPAVASLSQTNDSDPAATPYSMVSALNVPPVTAGLGDNQIVVNQWLADDLALKPGDQVQLSYFVLGGEHRLEERTNAFVVQSIVPMSGPALDRDLMPDFPGLAEAESTRQWDATLPIDLNRIRPKDEAYWKVFRGTPKAFIGLDAGQRLWGNRFGECTAVRFAAGMGSNTVEEVCRRLDPGAVGLMFEPVRLQAIAAAAQAQDFGQLFLGFSFFLVLAALLLLAMLFQFGLEQRQPEVATLLAVGYAPGQVRRLFLGEGLLVALLGGALGALGGLVYAWAMLRGLQTVWRGAVGATELGFHARADTLVMGSAAAVLVALATIWLAIHKLARKTRRARRAPASAQSRNRTLQRLGFGLAGTALALASWPLATRQFANAGAFFGVGTLVLLAELVFAAAWLGRLGSGTAEPLPGLGSLAVRGTARRRPRSLATIALLASGVFLVSAISVFRLDAARDGARRDSGTGGFALIGESTVPIVQDLNTAAGRDFFGLSADDLRGATIVSLRVRDGDEASCLNLARAQRPRLLGADPRRLQGRFLFTQAASGLDRASGWELLRAQTAAPNEIPAIGDANSIQWALGKKVGDTIDYVDEQGRPFRLKLVGAVANSILQGSLVIDEAAFKQRFPGESGSRILLIDAPVGTASNLAATLTRALENFGLETIPATRRLNEFNAVQNTYLGTFQLLGGLGLLLGSVGLGIVVLRNVLERRAEIGVLTALGYPRRTVRRLVLAEHGALLGFGLAAGLAAAAVAVLPSLLAPGAELPRASLGLTLLAILLNGALWTWGATRQALRGDLLAALRNE